MSTTEPATLRRSKTARALSWASSAATDAGVVLRTVLSSTPDTITSGSSPARRSVSSRAGEAEANTTRVDADSGEFI